MKIFVSFMLLAGSWAFSDKAQNRKRAAVQSLACSRVTKLAAASAAKPSEITSYCSAYLAAHMTTVTDVKTTTVNSIVDHGAAGNVMDAITSTVTTTTVTATSKETETVVKTRVRGTTTLTQTSTISRCGLPSGATIPTPSRSSSANQERNDVLATPAAFARFKSPRQVSLACGCYSISPGTTTLTSLATVTGAGAIAAKVTTTTTPTVTRTQIRTTTVTTDTTVKVRVTRTTTVLASSTTTMYTVTATPAMFYLYSEYADLFDFAQIGGGSYGRNTWLEFSGADGYGETVKFSITPHGALGTYHDIGFVRDYGDSSPARVLLRSPDVVAAHPDWTAVMCDITARSDGTCQLHCDGGHGEENRICTTSGQYGSYQVWYLGGSVAGGNCKMFTPIAISVDA